METGEVSEAPTHQSFQSVNTTLNFIWKIHHSKITQHSQTLIIHCNTCVNCKVLTMSIVQDADQIQRG